MKERNINNINFIFNLNDNVNISINNNTYVKQPQPQNISDEIVITSYYKKEDSNNELNSTASNSYSTIDLSSSFMLCKTQSGCRCIQNKIMSDPSFANSTLYPCLRPKMLHLINDKFGNYLYQQFLDVLETPNLEDLICFISDHFNSIAYSPHGTRVVQKLIEHFSQTRPSEAKLIYEKMKINLQGKICEIANDENANHIIQKFILLIKFPFNDFVYEEIYNNFVKIAITKYGCCVVQKCLMNGNQNQQQKIIFLILQNTFFLISNQFGNYVYQCLIFLNDDRIIMEIYKIIYAKIILLCKEKYSSNVIEKIFEIRNKSLINDIAANICQNEYNILELITDQYGNYIIQKIINSVTNPQIIAKIINVISHNSQMISKISFGKKLILKLSKKYKVLEQLIWA